MCTVQRLEIVKLWVCYRDNVSLTHNTTIFTVLPMNIINIVVNLQSILDLFLPRSYVKVDIPGFTETWWDPELARPYLLQGYNQCIIYRNRCGGGVAVCINNNFSSSVVADISILESYTECTGIVNSYFFVCIYRPP